MACLLSSFRQLALGTDMIDADPRLLVAMRH
jgi:hypothetical protein